MQQFNFLSLVFVLVVFQAAKAQQYDQLTLLKSNLVEVHHSPGHDKRAASITARVEKAMTYHQQLLGFQPTVILLVLSADDWSKHASAGAVYGMPHYTDNKVLIVAAEDNAFWKSFVPPMQQLPLDLQKQVTSVYTTADSSLSMQAFFDLLAIHELAHAFHLQAGLVMQRKWMGELFANMFLHTYIAENEPASLPALTLFPRMVTGGSTKEFLYTSLSDIQERYDEITRQYPKNYGWYQCKWHVAAATIYEFGGKRACKQLWDALKIKKEILTENELVDFLVLSGNKGIAQMIKNW